MSKKVPNQPQGASIVPAGKKWIHSNLSLTGGHVVYNVKFLGQVEVDQPKGSDIVKEAIRKLKFSRHLKKAEGNKPQKVELSVSIEGVAILDPKTKTKLFQFPLHRVSYCADDKTDKRICCMIAKDTRNTEHKCYVFDSDKCAEEITLTIGQAFDLAYQKFMDSSGRDQEMKKKVVQLQQKVQELELENTQLRQKVVELEIISGQRHPSAVNGNGHMNHQQQQAFSGMSPFSPTSTNNGLPPPYQATPTDSSPAPWQGFAESNSATYASPNNPAGGTTPSPQFNSSGALSNDSSGGSNLWTSGDAAPPLPPRPTSMKSPEAEGAMPVLAPPPPSRTRTTQKRLVSGQSLTSPEGAAAPNPFGEAPFNPGHSSQAAVNPFLDSFFEDNNREKQEGFGKGLMLDKDDFSLADLDPFNS